MERMRLSLATVWLAVALYIGIGLEVSWKTGAILLAVSLIPPIALFGLWNRPDRMFARRSRDPRSS